MSQRQRAFFATFIVLAVAALGPQGIDAASDAKKNKKRPKAVQVQQGRSDAEAVPSSERPEAGPLTDGPIKQIRPKLRVGPASDGRIRRITPGDGTPSSTPNQGADSRPNLPEMAPIPGPPQITGTGFQPGPVGSVGAKLFAPGGVIVIFGRNFGETQGTVRLRVDGSHFPEYPNGVPLQVLMWNDTQVNAKVPGPMTGPIAQVNVALQLKRVNPAKMIESPEKFQVPVERRVLKKTDREVRIIACHTGASSYRCNNGETTLSGFHRMEFGSLVAAVGRDQYAIHLEDGWVFSRVKHFHKDISGDDGDSITLEPEIPVGATSWAPNVRFMVSSDDKISYGINVEVMRAKGAY